MNDEKLIELVRNSPVLYDLTHSKYTDTELKNNIWNKIATKMKISAPLCRTRWSNIRDNFRRSLKKNKAAGDQEGKSTKHYKYAEQLSFLRKFFKEREIRKIVIDEVTNQDSTCDDDIFESVLYENEDNTQEYTTEVNNPVIVELQSHTSSNSRQTGSIQCPMPRMKRRQSVSSASPLKTATATVMEYPVKKHESMGCSSPPPQHPVDAFLTGIAPALKKLSPENWHYAKADIFAAVQKYEFRMLMDQQRIAKTSGESYHCTPANENEYQKIQTTDRSQQTIWEEL